MTALRSGQDSGPVKVEPHAFVPVLHMMFETKKKIRDDSMAAVLHKMKLSADEQHGEKISGGLSGPQKTTEATNAQAWRSI